MNQVLSADLQKNMYKIMLLARRIDEKNWILNRAGKVPFVVSGQGHEAAQVAMAFALDNTKDYIAPYYRDLATVLAFGMTTKDIMMSYFAKKEDPNSAGRQMPHHFSSKKLRILTGSSPLTTQLNHIVGLSYALRLDGINDVVCMASFGEGSSNQADFHDALNFASIYKLPVIFMCENNKYAISTRVELQIATKDVAERAKGYNMPGFSVNGLDVAESYHVSKKAVDRARKGEGPSLIEFHVSRLTAHSSDDNVALYISKDEIANLKQQDPLLIFKNQLLEKNIANEDELATMLKSIDKEIEESIDAAEAASFSKPEDSLKHVYSS